MRTAYFIYFSSSLRYSFSKLFIWGNTLFLVYFRNSFSSLFVFSLITSFISSLRPSVSTLHVALHCMMIPINFSKIHFGPKQYASNSLQLSSLGLFFLHLQTIMAQYTYIFLLFFLKLSFVHRFIASHFYLILAILWYGTVWAQCQFSWDNVLQYSVFSLLDRT